MWLGVHPPVHMRFHLEISYTVLASCHCLRTIVVETWYCMEIWTLHGVPNRPVRPSRDARAPFPCVVTIVPYAMWCRSSRKDYQWSGGVYGRPYEVGNAKGDVCCGRNFIVNSSIYFFYENKITNNNRSFTSTLHHENNLFDWGRSNKSIFNEK